MGPTSSPAVSLSTATERTFEALKGMMSIMFGSESGWATAVRSPEVQAVLKQHGPMTERDLCDKNEKGQAMLLALRKHTGSGLGWVCE